MIKKIVVSAVLVAILLAWPVPRPATHDAMPTMPEDIKQQLYTLGVIDKIKAPGELSMLNQFWAFGLANKNPILEHGPMTDPQYGGAGRFASTGGWTLAKGGAMAHYSMHQLVSLTPEQQALVERVSKNVYRPCCRNSTYFPDCNHGMAMLGILELLAAQGKTETELYNTAKAVNAVWFPPQPTGGGCSV